MEWKKTGIQRQESGKNGGFSFGFFFDETRYNISKRLENYKDYTGNRAQALPDDRS
jgi:hypothetical protein